MKFIRNWKYSLPAAGVALLGLAWLAFGYFGIHTAFIDDEVSEAAPVFDAVPAADVSDVDTVDPVILDADVSETDVGEPAADTADTEADTVADIGDAEAAPAEAPDSDPEAAAQPEIVTEFAGQFSGTGRYDVSGEAVVLGNGTGQRFLRFEDFESNNGPDLNVYLVNPDDPSDFIDLGDLKGNIGEQNYEISADVDLERYSQVSIWCVRFSVGFGFADLA